MAFNCNVTKADFLYWQAPAFLDGSPGNFSGLLYDSYQSILSACCKDATSIVYNYKLIKDERTLVNNAKVLNSISMPVFAAGSPGSVWPRNFIPVIDSNVYIFLAAPINSSGSLQMALSALWPLLIVLFGLVAAVAYVIWFMETYLARERSTLNRSFGKGVIEAMWYVFITASTVGFGDKVAKSAAGRVTTVIWIITSWVLLTVVVGTFSSLYNFAGSASLTMPTVSGNSIGIINGSVSRIIVEYAGGFPIKGKNFTDLVSMLLSGSVSGLLLDPFSFVQLFGYSSSMWATSDLRMSIIQDYSLTGGFVFLNSYDAHVAPEVFDCLASSAFAVRVANAYTQTSLMLNLTRGYSTNSLNDYASGMFSSTQVLTVIAIFCGSVGVLMVITQVVYCVLRRHSKSRSDVTLHGTNFTDLTSVVASECGSSQTNSIAKS